MNENASSDAARVIDEPECVVKVRTKLSRRHVTDRYTLVGELVGKAIHDFRGYVEDMRDAVTLKSLSILRYFLRSCVSKEN